MPDIIINQEKIIDIDAAISLCPFNAIEYSNGTVSINSGCKMCSLCIKKGPPGAFVKADDDNVGRIDKSKWSGVAVYVEHHHGTIHPVTLELIGKAREIASKIFQKVICLFIGENISEEAAKLLVWGVDEVYVYDNRELAGFRTEPYTNVFEDFINRTRPSIVLVGGTNLGRTLAPRIAARLRTGLTADCTMLDVQKNTDLDQIRPAYGGNIMAHIRTPNNRPQFATVRYKIFSAPEKVKDPSGKIIRCNIDGSKLKSAISIIGSNKKEKLKSIEEADVIIAAGRAFRKQEDLQMVYDLAELLNAQVASTRPLVECGWINPRNQIGLSGKTVKPKLILALGISGSIQFIAGMNGAETIVAINKDANAPIFNVAHYAITGDLYQIVPKLIKDIKKAKCTGQETGTLSL